MRVSEIILIVRQRSDADLAKGLTGGMRRLILQVVGEANSLTPETLRRLRRSGDAQKRRTPVVVWAADSQDAEIWRNAGALTVSGKFTAEGASKAIDKAGLVPWVESQVYVGPDRRHRKSWLNLGGGARRLADAQVGRQPDKAPADMSSFDTRMRQLRMACLAMNDAERERRAQFLNDVRSAVRAAEGSRRMHAARALESLARYLAARGAKGGLDQALIERHLDACDASPTDAAPLIMRLERSVDRALGLGQPG
jgi:hypothetical protein